MLQTCTRPNFVLIDLQTMEIAQYLEDFKTPYHLGLNSELNVEHTGDSLFLLKDVVRLISKFTKSISLWRSLE